MALTKVQKTGITDNAIDADKIEDGTIVAADIAPGTITNAKLAGSIANDKLANSSITVNGSSVSLGGSVTAGKVEWQAVKTADFNAVAGEGYFVDTDSVGAVTATLPGSPSAGDTIAFKDYAENFGTNALTIARNGNNIQGVANDSLISTNRASIVLVYIDATKGWLYTNESNVNFLGPTYIEATGGTITTSGDYKIHTFTGDGCFVVCSVSSVPSANEVSYIVVAGGGGGGENIGGGGGAGGFRESKAGVDCYSASPLEGATNITVTASTYPITVGGGGAGSTSPSNKGSSGSNSVFSTITSAGGGGAGTQGGGGAPNPTRIALNGGSGGGGAGNKGEVTAGSGNTPPVSPSQGNSGGEGGTEPVSVSNVGAGGGGGATAVGTSLGNSPDPNGGPGGAGATTSITGSPTAYAGGGAGGGNPGPGGTGGSGGGGNGEQYTTSTGLTSGTANTGGGGGGAGTSNGAAGGKGIVIIRYKFQ